MLRYLVLAAAVQQILFPFFINPFGANSANSQAGAAIASGIAPAGYAFAIWGPIYLGALAYGLWQVTAAGAQDGVAEHLAAPLIVLYLGSSLWLWFAQNGPLWGTVPTLAVMAAMAIYALTIVSAADQTGWMRWLILVLPLALYAGWTSCAVFVNFAEVAPVYGFDRLGLSRGSFGVLLLALATLLAVGVLWATRGQSAYAATIVWALAAIIAAVFMRKDPAIIGAASGMGIVVVIAAAWWLRRMEPAISA